MCTNYPNSQNTWIWNHDYCVIGDNYHGWNPLWQHSSNFECKLNWSFLCQFFKCQFVLGKIPTQKKVNIITQDLKKKIMKNKNLNTLKHRSTWNRAVLLGNHLMCARAKEVPKGFYWETMTWTARIIKYMLCFYV